MGWFVGVVTFAKRGRRSDGGEYGMLSVDGVQMFCRPEMVQPVGTEVRVNLTGQSRRDDKGDYQNSQNASVVQVVTPAPAGDGVAPGSNGVAPTSRAGVAPL